MTTYIDYDDIQSELDTNWNDVIIAKPNFQDGDIQDEFNATTVMIMLLESDAPIATTGSGSRDQIITEFKITPISTVKANLDKYLDEIRRIINGKDLTNGFWHVDSWKLFKAGEFFYYECICSENLWDFA